MALGEVAKLASVLSIRFGDMFSPELLEAPKTTGSATERVAEVRGLLYEMGKLVPRSALCQALDCSPDELDDALTEPAAVPAPAGLTVYAAKDSLSIVAAAGTDTKSLKTLIRSQLSSQGSAITDGSILAEVAQGMRARRKLSTRENTALQRLRKAGIIEKDRAELSGAARLSLLL